MGKWCLTWEQVFPKGAYLAEVRKSFMYQDGKKTDIFLGYSYVVASRMGFDKVVIKTSDKVPKITPEELENASKDISVTAKGFAGSVYNSNGNIHVSATAEEVTLS